MNTEQVRVRQWIQVIKSKVGVRQWIQRPVIEEKVGVRQWIQRPVIKEKVGVRQWIQRPVIKEKIWVRQWSFLNWIGAGGHLDKGRLIKEIMINKKTSTKHRPQNPLNL